MDRDWSQGWGRRCAVLALGVAASWLAGCYAEPSLYRGVGALQSAGGSAELSSQTVTLTSCPAVTTEPETPFGGKGPRPGPTVTVVLSIGDECDVTRRSELGEPFRVDDLAVCKLMFAHETRALRLTDVMVRYGDSSVEGGLALSPPGDGTGADGLADTYRDLNHMEVQLAGVDVADGRLAVYRFFGHAAPGRGDPKRCTALRPPRPSPPAVGDRSSP